jgi:hypothetical protein
VNYEEIEKYLHKGLDENEQQSFEQALAADPALAAEVELYRQTELQLLAKANADAGEPQLKEQLSALSKEYFNKKAPAPVVRINKRKRLYYYIGGAAAALLAILLVQPLLTTQKPVEELYAVNAEKIYKFSGARGGSNTSGNAVYLFDTKKYKEALAILEPIPTKDTDTLLAKAVCYLETGNSGKALEIYNGMIASQTQAEKATLYKAMLYLKQGDKTACRNTLKLIPEGSDYYANAASLLKGL